MSEQTRIIDYVFRKKEGDRGKTEEWTMERRKGEKNGIKKGKGRGTRSKKG
jgi:hypothetical protein